MSALQEVSYALMQHMVIRFARGAGRSFSEKATTKDLRITTTRSSSSTIGEISFSNPATGSTTAFYQPPPD